MLNRVGWECRGWLRIGERCFSPRQEGKKKGEMQRHNLESLNKEEDTHARWFQFPQSSGIQEDFLSGRERAGPEESH